MFKAMRLGIRRWWARGEAQGVWLAQHSKPLPKYCPEWGVRLRWEPVFKPFEFGDDGLPVGGYVVTGARAPHWTQTPIPGLRTPKGPPSWYVIATAGDEMTLTKWKRPKHPPRGGSNVRPPPPPPPAEDDPGRIIKAG